MPTVPSFDPNTADTSSIAEWLATALDGYFKDDLGRWAFRPLEQHIGLREDVADDLCAIYDPLTAAAQSRWRSAIRDALAFHGRDNSKREAARVLVDFAVLVRSPEVLHVLPGILSGKDDGELLDLAVGAATALASQTEASRKCLERIRSSPAFTSDYAGLILVALCHADPDKWLYHVKELAVPMHELASRLSPGSTALRFYASRILDAISLRRVADVSLNHLATDSSGQASWLAKEWLVGEDSLLCVQPTATNMQLVLRADNAVSTELEDPLDSTVFTTYGLQTRHKTAIVWEREEDKTWVAVCSDRLTDLAPVEPSQQALIAFMEAHLGEQISVWWNEEQVPRHGGIVFIAPDRLFPITGDRLLALWNKKISDRLTDRVDYLRKYRKRIEPTLRRRAFEDSKAFRATASALALAPATV